MRQQTFRLVDVLPTLHGHDAAVWNGASTLASLDEITKSMVFADLADGLHGYPALSFV
jgi:hypothetical protein